MLKHHKGGLVDRICLLWHVHGSRCIKKKKAKTSFAVTVLPIPVFPDTSEDHIYVPDSQVREDHSIFYMQ